MPEDLDGNISSDSKQDTHSEKMSLPVANQADTLAFEVDGIVPGGTVQ
jgi:hypothetical protein